MANPIPTSLLPAIEVWCLLINDKDAMLPLNSLHIDVQTFLFGSPLPPQNTTEDGIYVPLYLKNYARPRYLQLIPEDDLAKILRHFQRETAQSDGRWPAGCPITHRKPHTMSKYSGDHSNDLNDAVSPQETTSTLSQDPESSLAEPRLERQSPDVEGEDSASVANMPLYKPHGRWAHMENRSFDKVTTVKHLSGGANCEVFYQRGETDGRAVALINKRWDVWKDWNGFFSELFLYASSSHLRQFQGVHVPFIVGVYVSPDGFVDVLMEPPHNATRWTEAHPFTTPSYVKDKIIQAYREIHKRGVMHYDTELRHILITDKEEVCLIDWQLARSLSRNETVALDKCTRRQLEGEMRRVKFLIDYKGARVKEIMRWVGGDEAIFRKNQESRRLRFEGQDIGQLSDEEWDEETEAWLRVDPRDPSWFDRVETKVSGREFVVPSPTTASPVVSSLASAPRAGLDGDGKVGVTTPTLVVDGPQPDVFHQDKPVKAGGAVRSWGDKAPSRKRPAPQDDDDTQCAISPDNILPQGFKRTIVRRRGLALQPANIGSIPSPKGRVAGSSAAKSASAPNPSKRHKREVPQSTRVLRSAYREAPSVISKPPTKSSPPTKATRTTSSGAKLSARKLRARR